MNAELGVTGWLRQQLQAGVRVVTDTPADLAAALPLVAIDWLGGGQDLNLARPMFRATSYAGTKTDASALADTVHDLIVYRLRGEITGGYITGVHVILSPAQNTGYGNPAVVPYVAQYQCWVLDPVNHF